MIFRPLDISSPLGVKFLSRHSCKKRRWCSALLIHRTKSCILFRVEVKMAFWASTSSGIERSGVSAPSISGVLSALEELLLSSAMEMANSLSSLAGPEGLGLKLGGLFTVPRVRSSLGPSAVFPAGGLILRPCRRAFNALLHAKLILNTCTNSRKVHQWFIFPKSFLAESPSSVGIQKNVRGDLCVALYTRGKKCEMNKSVRWARCDGWTRAWGEQDVKGD